MSARAIITAVAIAGCATPAFAHAFLQHAEPGAGAALKASPERVALTFSEKLEPVLSGIAVTDSAGHNVEADPVVIRGKSLVSSLRPLPPGSYRVIWHVVSIDKHRTEGTYRFAVKP